MASDDLEINSEPNAQSTMDRYRVGNSSNNPSYAIGAVILGGMLYVFFGGDVSDHTTLPPTITTIPQITTPTPAVAATK